MRLSIRNQLTCTVQSVTKGEAMAVVKVQVAGGTVLTSSVTLDAVNDLGISEGSEVTLLVKSTDVALGVN